MKEQSSMKVEKKIIQVLKLVIILLLVILAVIYVMFKLYLNNDGTEEYCQEDIHVVKTGEEIVSLIE